MKSMKWLGGFALIMILSITLAVPATAGDDDKKIGIWQNDVELGVNILQSSYSNNWNGGEKGSIVWTGNLDAKFEKQFTEMTNWRNTLKLVYGQTHQQERNGGGDLFWKKPDKTDDLIDFESLFRWTGSQNRFDLPLNDEMRQRRDHQLVQSAAHGTCTKRRVGLVLNDLDFGCRSEMNQERFVGCQSSSVKVGNLQIQNPQQMFILQGSKSDGLVEPVKKFDGKGFAGCAPGRSIHIVHRHPVVG